MSPTRLILAHVDVGLLGQAVDDHNLDQTIFAAVHCNSGDDCHQQIARRYNELVTQGKGKQPCSSCGKTASRGPLCRECRDRFVSVFP